LERFNLAPSLSSPTDIVSVNSSYDLSWDVWYNYRNKQNLPGNYTLYIDSIPSQTGVFNYTKFWKPSTIPIDTGHLGLGVHNVTLEIDDGYGNKNSDAVSIHVEAIQISRIGRTTIEKGQTDLLPTWSGFTASELHYNITLNGTLHEELNWTGQDIVLDPASIALGVHDVYFQLFNNSDLVFDDSFLLQVHPTAPPVLTPLQASEVDILWSDPLLLTWNISDSSPES
jgi:hypothetical protein